MKHHKLVSVSEYATMSGVTQQAIYSRIKSGNIVVTKHPHGNGFVSLIDLTIYPPCKLDSGRKPYKGNN